MFYIFPDPCRWRKTCETELHKKAQNGKENNLSHFGESEESNTNFKLWSFRKNRDQFFCFWKRLKKDMLWGSAHVHDFFPRKCKQQLKRKQKINNNKFLFNFSFLFFSAMENNFIVCKVMRRYYTINSDIKILN